MKFSAYSLLFGALVVGIACTQSARAQTFKRVLVQGGAKLAQIAPGGVSVWARATNGKPYILKGKQFALANSITLSQIAVGGGNAFQADTVWGLNSAGSIFTATKSGTTWVFSPVPGVLDFIAVGIGYQDSCHPYEVWGLNPAAQIFRYNYCLKNWEQIAGTLNTLSTGGGDVWGLNGNGTPFVFNFATLSFDPVPDGPNRSYRQITVGPYGAWAISTTAGVYEYDKLLFEFFPVAASLVQIQAGGSGVWGIDYAHGANPIFRFQPSTLTFIQFPGDLTSISVGSGGGVWGINSAGQAYGFSAP